MSDTPPTTERWPATVLSPEHWPYPLYHRAPYHHHKDHTNQLEPICQALCGDIPYGGLSKLLQAIHISDSTLSHWKKMLMVNSSWRPSRRASAMPRRIFSDEQEDQLIARIRRKNLDNGLYYCDEDFRLNS
jgi:hypothetical protein